MRKQFYEKVLPSQGIYCAAGIDRTGRTYHRFVETLDDLETEIENFQTDGLNAFVAMNTFSGHSRKADYAAYCKSFFIDLDVGEDDPKKYPSKDAALEALDYFLKVTELPPPVRVDSGGGIHAYWILDRDVPTAEWKAYATKFKQLCLDHIKIDPAVTADAARIMRCPETLHLKGEPKPTLFLDSEFVTYDFDMFKEYLGEVQLDVESILAILPKGLDDDTREIAKLNNFQTTFQEIAEKSLSGDGCNQIRNILTNAATLEEPLWYAGLSIARHCTDWETAIHLMSEDHPEYNRETTIRKSEQALGKPFACDKFESLNPGGCKECPFRGRITNPLAIGRRLAEAPTVEEVGPEDAVRIEQDSKTIPSFPAFLKPYARGVNGGVYYVPPSKVDEDGKKVQEDPICLSVNDLAPLKRMYSAADGETMMMRHLMKHDPTKEFLLPMKMVYATDKFKEILSSHSVSFIPQHINHLANYMIKWNQYLQSKDKAEIMHMQMGWTENNDAFVVGLTEIGKDGEERKASASPLVRNISKLLNPVGDYDLWKKSANALNQPGFEMHAFGVLCGFGSPLMRYTSTSGVMVSFTSVESGNAKTGAMYGGISVWGDPKELSVVDGNATDNAFIGRLLNLKNIMFGIDEASNARPEDISRLVHRISQGKAKMRMQASVNAERDLEMTASLIAMLTSNHPMYDKLQAIKASPDGEVARLVEFVIERPEPMVDNPRLGKEIFDPFRHNYGYAGIEFVKHLFKVGDDVIRQKMSAWQSRFEDDFGTDASFRFYQNLVLATFTAGELAVEAGILEYDLPRIYKKVVNKMIDIRDNTVKIAPSDFKTLLGEFGDLNQSKFLFMDGEKLINSYDPRELIGRIEIDTGMYYVSRTEFKKFLREHGVSTRQFEAVMKEDKVLIGVEKKRLGAGWKGGASFHPIWVYAFKTNNVEELINAKKN